MNTLHKIGLAVIVTVIFVESTMAGNFGQHMNSGFMSLSIFGGASTNGKSKTFYLQPDVQNSYQPSSSTPVVGGAEIFVGQQNWLNIGYLSDYYFQFGVALAAMGGEKREGDIWEFANQEYDNFTYSYGITSFRALLKGKLILEVSDCSQVFAFLGVGASHNSTNNFRIKPKIFSEVVPPSFESQSTTQFTYAAGVGMEYALSQNHVIGIGYEFADWGKSKLDRARGQTLSSGLQIDHLYTNTLSLILSFVN